MKKGFSVLWVVPLLLFHATPANAQVINLFNWAFSIDGVVYDSLLGDPLPGEGVLDASGLGELSFDVSGVGDHTFIAYFDFEIDEATNTYFNEFGGTSGSAAAGQSWEIDEPGWVFGDIYDNMLAGELDNTNAVSAGSPDDVAFALGWDFTLGLGETAEISLTLSDILATDDFYIFHSDPETGLGFDETTSIYAWSDINITTVHASEPAVALMFGAGAFGVIAFRRRRGMDGRGL